MAQISRPAVVFRSHSDQILRVYPVTLPAGRSLTDWSSFKLTLRTDPEWPRQWYHRPPQADPYYDSWAVALQATLTAGEAVVTVSGSPALEFPIAAADIDLAAGEERYALDVRGIGGTPGEVPLVDATWVTLLPRVG